MYFYLILIVGIGIVVNFLFILWSVFRRKNEKVIRLHDTSLTCEELEEHAKKIAVEHDVSRKASLSNWPLPRMNDNYNFIISVYRELNEDVQKKHTAPPAAEWLLDNFYIIEEQVKTIRRDLTREEYSRLPALRCGTLKGYARIYAIAIELVSHTDGQIDDRIITNYIKAYQSHSSLSDREIWAMPTMIRMALIEKIRYVCEKIHDTEVHWRKADELVDSMLNIDGEDTEKPLKTVENKIQASNEINSSFIEHLAYKLRRAGKGYTQALRFIDEELAKFGTSIDIVTQKEHNTQAINTVSMGNCIVSLKFITSLDWIEIFESSSQVEQTLYGDPDGTYKHMDLTSRNFYRNKIEDLASLFRVSELHVAREAIELARQAGIQNVGPENYRTHVGYYLIGKGIRELEKRLNYTPGLNKRFTNAIRRNPAPLYLGSIAIITLLLMCVAIQFSYLSSVWHRLLFTLLAGLAVLIPASEIAINLVNWVICNLFKPLTFPKLELKSGIPEEYSTIVVIPALLTDEKRVRELVENLETHYLANKDKNLYFAIAGDFKDATVGQMAGDHEIIKAGINGVKALNQKYCGEGPDIFYYFHRIRQFNERHGKWMGWERKRGALLEFNDLLLGSKLTSYKIISNDNLPSPPVTYVITLDADTILPIGGARKMIGTIAHPLNRPILDDKKGIVVEGYGLIQPRIVFDIESANRSLFSRIFTGQEGIDPYACAISDVYQDLFGEGIFTGKGIYDLKTFHNVLQNAFPENAILSHDLLEGSYVRTGLATDLELIDSYPSSYGSYGARMHRWVRGDWQLMPWLCSSITDGNGKRIKNPLSLISKWKILDNMRRSLFAPSLMILMALGLSILPGSSLFWFCFLAVSLAFPLITAVIDNLISLRFNTHRVKRYVPVISGLKAILLQVLLLLIFLPYQAYLMADAIIRTVFRVLVTKKNMLEWVTAADVEKGQKNSFKSFWAKMNISLLEALVLVIFSLLFKPFSLFLSLPLMALWGTSPLTAYKISRSKPDIPYRLPPSDWQELRRIARKTWRYFEEFVNPKNHYLPPDNYQEDPPNGLAFRSSPTNIGLGLLSAMSARDLGYIGTQELIEIASNTVSTIEKMEKWNGHLYNWYDTRTLRPLRPRYVSTVDNGNFICYLITLIQGLYGYLDSPLNDIRFIEGIKDTSDLIKEREQAYSRLELLDGAVSGKGLDLIKWSRALETLSSDNMEPGMKKSRWRTKTDRMISMFRRDLSEFMPWLGLLSAMPDELAGDVSDLGNSSPANDVIKSLLSNPSLKSYPEVCKNAINDIEKHIRELEANSPQTNREWLERFKDSVYASKEFTEQFIDRYMDLIKRIESICDSTHFKPLYVEKKQVFSIGYNIEENRLTNSYYDLLASEARQTSYLAIARGEVPPKHWFKLGRTLTVVDGYKGLVSWTGTMFEYLMAPVIMKTYKNTLLDETYSFVIRSQKKYGKQRQAPWGSSESGFYSLDINLDYQYKAIGVPWLGLKRGLVEDLVVTPYATFLALPLDPVSSMENIKRLKAEGLDGPYGFYEAVDYTIERMPFGLKHAIVKSYMAHHEGMSLLSLNNYLNDNIMQRRFHDDPVIKSAQLLLQEKVPANLVFTKEAKEKIVPFKDVVFKEKGPYRKYRQPDPVLPKVHILSNGNYSVMLTDRGTGFSKNKMVSVTRWREDSTLDNYGMFFYIRNVDTDKIWSAAYQPFGTPPDKYEVAFTSDKAKYKRKDGDIETETEIVVTSGDNAEVRRIILKNRGQAPCILEVTSYFEVVLASQGADIAHPVFSNLFVRTEFLPESNSIIANRRPRTENDKSLWVVNTPVVDGEIVGGVQYETDRMQFIGRDHTVANPVVLERNKPLSNSVGPVLDPIMSLRFRVKIPAGQAAKISYITAVSESRDAALEFIEKYSTPESVEGAFKLALTRSQVETRYLNIKASEIELYQDIISHIMFISPLQKLSQDYTINNRKGQSALWPYGISGDLPVVLVILKKSDEVDIVYEALKAHEYWRLKDLKVDLVILNEEEGGYTHPLRTLLADVVSSSHAHDIINKPGGVYILNRNNMPDDDAILLCAIARVVLKGNNGSLAEQIKAIPNNVLPGLKTFSGKPGEYGIPDIKLPELLYFNGLGGFLPDGREYVIQLEKGQNTPLPWINVIANPHFGFLATESGSGYTWCENSRENKLSPWSNDPVSDTPGEVLYLSDDNTGDLWTITPLPIREDQKYIARHGFGYTGYEHTSHGIEQQMIQFVAVDEPVKISIIRLKNTSGSKRGLSLTYYIRPVLGVSDQLTASQITTSLGETGTFLVENPYNEEFPGRIAFIDVSEKERSVTGDRKEFFGNGTLSAPEALKRQKLSGTTGAGTDPCAAIQTSISLNPDETKEIAFLFGMGRDKKEVSDLTAKYKNIANAKNALKQVKNFWESRLETVQVHTPDESMNIMLNGWLMYQTVVCRLWARSAFYQSGGAYGFRDQLQDSLSVAHAWPDIAYNQILLHSRHQFIEGDVQHWWHEPHSKGTRTRFSDDLLWLPYVTAEYIRISGNFAILENVSPFLEDEPLKEFEDERYCTPHVSGEESSLYDHCIRAIERSLKFGEHGIPLMGSGDWNDGMSMVGNRGKGESVWLGWFLYSTLMKFAPICKLMGDEDRSNRYVKTANKIAEAIEENAWDGNWYRRAYFDSGIPLGSVQNSECRIDSISQSWAVISGAGDSHRVVEAMNSLENYLVQRDEGLIKLLTPPFDEGDLEPGYIKGYVPGVRENGGQYTHASAWVIIAFAELGEGDKAWELFELINPINHTRTHMEYSKYKTEPYVMSADVYAVSPHVGRGGWTWYTGSSGWIYRAGLEYILGFKKNGNSLVIDPCIPKKWAEYTMRYKYMETTYEIVVKNPEGVSKGVKSIIHDGNSSAGNVLPLVNDGAVHQVEVLMGK